MKIRVIHKDGREQNPNEELFAKYYVKGPFNIKEGKQVICSFCEKEDAKASYKFKHHASLLFYNFCNENCLVQYLQEIQPHTHITTPIPTRKMETTPHNADTPTLKKEKSQVNFELNFDTLTYEQAYNIFSKYKSKVAMIL